MTNYANMKGYGSKFIAGKDVGTVPKPFTITGSEVKLLGQGPDQDEKVIIHGQQWPKPLALNNTRFEALTGLLGFDGDAWTGQTIMIQARALTNGSFKGQLTIDINGLQQAEQPEGEIDF